jgi:hypothetical protein
LGAIVIVDDAAQQDKRPIRTISSSVEKMSMITNQTMQNHTSNRMCHDFSRDWAVFWRKIGVDRINAPCDPTKPLPAPVTAINPALTNDDEPV